METLSKLERMDKWFLGGGKGALYAPPFPRWLTIPGFWDECYLADIRLHRLFTLLFLNAAGRPVRLRGQVTRWRPDSLEILHEGADHALLERRCVLPNHAWTSELRLLSGSPLQAFVWSLQDLQPQSYGTPHQTLADCVPDDAGIAWTWRTSWPAEIEPDRTAVESETLSGAADMLAPLDVFLKLGGSLPREGWAVLLAQRHDDSPLYETSILPEQVREGRLRQEFKLRVGPAPHEGLVHLVQQYELGSSPLVVACGAGLSPEEAASNLGAALEENPATQSERAWKAYFSGVPQLSTSDPFIETAYWYRWYGLRLNTVDMPNLPIAGGKGRFSPFVTEGIGFFRNFITYSAQAHLREVAWMHDPALGVGILQNLEKCQRPDGSIPGHNYTCRPERDFYHADFIGGLRALEGLHGVDVERFRPFLTRYADYFLGQRRSSATGLFQVWDQNETGQEYMSRYQFVSENADQWASFRVGAVDATAYLLELLTWLRHSAAEETLAALCERFWDPADSFFSDCLEDGTRSPARPGTGFYPYMSSRLPDLAARLQAPSFIHGLRNWLLNPSEFWLHAFPATAKSDPTYSAEPEWKDKRLNCPWNGRSWPMANSHMVEALCNTALTLAPELKPQAGEAVLKAVHLLFHDGDPTRPCCYEHYNPETGAPALYRGYDDYMHSWVVDLIMRYVVGVRPGHDTPEPLVDGVDFECHEIPWQANQLSVVRRGGLLATEVSPV